MLRKVWPSLFREATSPYSWASHNAGPHPQGPVTLTGEPQPLACSPPKTHPCNPRSHHFPSPKPGFSPEDLCHSSSPRYSPSLRDRPEAGGRAHIDAEERSHAVQVVGVPRHGQDLGDDSSMGPLLPKLLHQFLQVAGGRLADGIDCRRTRGGGGDSEVKDRLRWGVAVTRTTAYRAALGTGPRTNQDTPRERKGSLCAKCRVFFPRSTSSRAPRYRRAD